MMELLKAAGLWLLNNWDDVVAWYKRHRKKQESEDPAPEKPDQPETDEL